MAVASLIPELEEVIQHGSFARRAETLRRITDLFAEGAGRLKESHIQLFDDVFCQLAAQVDTTARAELSNRLAVLGNAPRELIRRLAKDDDAAVARGVLRRSQRLEHGDLIDIAEAKSQAHLLAISKRRGIPPTVTDILVRRGDQAVLRGLAENLDAQLSEASFVRLVERAAEDGVLAEKIGSRPDLPPRLFSDLLLDSTQAVQQRLLAAAKPELRSEIARVLTEASATEQAQASRRDYEPAQRKIAELNKDGKLDEAALVDFARIGRGEEMTAALAVLCAVPVDVVDRLVAADRPDPVLILCKSAGWGWQTVKAILAAMPQCCRLSSRELDMAYENFERLSPTTAQRVMRFWQVQHWQHASSGG
ncbi:MAG TPA: DUF2336 domain-containing protein [Xanthobacteraceae bacterium]|jgi:uncharacterized protein (DUF2336 family)